MRQFTQLFRELDESCDAADKAAALQRYFRKVPAEDAAWALWFLWGNQLRLRISSRRLSQWATDLAGLPDWLVAASRKHVGDLAETASLLLPLAGSRGTALPLHEVVEEKLLPLKNWDDHFQFQLLRDFWLTLDRDQALVAGMMMTRSVRPGVSRAMLVRALANALDLAPADMAHRLCGDWDPTGTFFRSLADKDGRRAMPQTVVPNSALASLLEELDDAAPATPHNNPLHRATLVLVYAGGGDSRRANDSTSYRMAVRDGEGFVAVATVKGGLGNEDSRAIARWIDQHTLARRGPVRTVPPELVFEIGFEGLRASSRHKSGLVLRSPRILRWLKDKPVEEIHTLESLLALLPE